MSRFLAALACAALVGALFLALAARPSLARSSACATTGYGYAGMVDRNAAHGVAATIATTSLPRVQSGHAAAWVGVGGVGAGPRGRSEWLQAGIAAFPGRAPRIYYELVRPGEKRRYVDLGRAEVGRSYRVAVYELPHSPERWVVTVDGREAAAAVHLPGSHGTWRGVATSETWVAGGRACNLYGFRVGDVETAQAPGAWAPLEQRTLLRNAGSRLTLEGPAGFRATALA